MCATVDCIFCKIISGQIPSRKVYEDEHVLAFLDISVATLGHTLVIPKHHVTDVFDLDANTSSQLFRVIPSIARALEETFSPKGLNMVNNNREAAGQTVFHYHVHLIPRYDSGDGWRATWQSNAERYTATQLDDFASRIGANIKTGEC
ncbi:MAG: HIT family protein [Bacilli bacterium]